MNEHAIDQRWQGAQTARLASYDGRRAGEREKRAKKRERRISTFAAAMEHWAYFGEMACRGLPGKEVQMLEEGDVMMPTEEYHYLRVEAAIMAHVRTCSVWHLMARAPLERAFRASLADHYRKGVSVAIVTQSWPGGGLMWARFKDVVEAELLAHPYLPFEVV